MKITECNKAYLKYSCIVLKWLNNNIENNYIDNVNIIQDAYKLIIVCETEHYNETIQEIFDKRAIVDIELQGQCLNLSSGKYEDVNDCFGDLIIRSLYYKDGKQKIILQREL